MMDGFDHLPFYRNMTKVEDAITEETAAILLEPVQGEGGIKPVSADNLQALREICDKHGILLIYDEVQCGMGRTGKLFAHQHCGIAPDIMASAKGIGGGFPLGACLANEKVGRSMQAGSHGSTYGGNPLAMAVGNAVIDVVLADGFLDHVEKTSYDFRMKLMKLKNDFPTVIELVRGLGLMLGMKIHTEPARFMKKALEHGLVVIPAGDNTVRILPPLIINEDHIEEAMEKLTAICQELAKELAAEAKTETEE